MNSAVKGVRKLGFFAVILLFMHCYSTIQRTGVYSIGFMRQAEIVDLLR